MAIAFRTSTLLRFHRALVQRKYRLLLSPKQRTKPGPKGPAADLIGAVVEMKKRNPTCGCPQIADQINPAFGTSINKGYGSTDSRPPPSTGTRCGECLDRLSFWTAMDLELKLLSFKDYYNRYRVDSALGGDKHRSRLRSKALS